MEFSGTPPDADFVAPSDREPTGSSDLDIEEWTAGRGESLPGGGEESTDNHLVQAESPSPHADDAWFTRSPVA